MDDYSVKLVDYLFSGMEGFKMEEILTSLLSIRHGSKFEALGGRKDGGADGVFSGVYSAQHEHYLQISREGGVEKKIQKTIDRLRQVGREVKGLTYWTHLEVPMRDVFEDNISSEKGVIVRIRDKSSVVDLVNSSSETKRFISIRFKGELDELVHQGGGDDGGVSGFAIDPTVYAYLKFEVTERSDRGVLIEPVVDALIYWALRDTDPDRMVLVSRSEIKSKILDVLPGAQNIVLPKLNDRLDYLCSRQGGQNQRVRYYKASDSFCLPYEMRLMLAEESADDRQLQAAVLNSLTERAVKAGAGDQAELVAKVTIDVVYQHFYEQGTVLAAFLDKRLESITTQEQVIETELRRFLDAETTTREAYSSALSVLRGFFYEPAECELRFQRQLSKTSLLLTSMKHSPKLLEYFNRMSGGFRLMVGSDMLVKALSEYYLPAESKTVTNLLLAAKEAGANLILIDPVVDEIFTHLHATHLEFKNHYAAREQYISKDLSSQSSRILIRSYFYAKSSRRLKGWRSYIETFVDFGLLDLRSVRARDQLRAFVQKLFGLEYLSSDDLKVGVDMVEVGVLADKLSRRDPDKNRALADNDALAVHSVYAFRKKYKEAYKYDGFGLSTWWLTKEIRVLRYTHELVKKHGTPYIMRPEFLLNFLALSPSAHLTKKTRELLPAHVGLQLGHHLSDGHMEKLLSAVEEWDGLPPERIEVKISEFADKLKYDRFKRYGKEFSEDEYDFINDEIASFRKQG